MRLPSQEIVGLSQQECSLARSVFDLLRVDDKGTFFSKRGEHQWSLASDADTRVLALEATGFSTADIQVSSLPAVYMLAHCSSQELLSLCTPDHAGCLSFEANTPTPTST